MPTVTDREVRQLVAQARAGSRHSLGQLFDIFVDRVFRFLSHRMPSQEQAEDMTQTVFLEMIQSLPRYRPQAGAKFSTWLFQIARHRLIDFYRRQKREVPLDDIVEPAIEPAWADPVEQDALRQALSQLPERYSTVLQLRYHQDLPTAEVARIMNVSSINVRVLQHRAIKALRQRFRSRPVQPVRQFLIEAS